MAAGKNVYRSTLNRKPFPMKSDTIFGYSEKFAGLKWQINQQFVSLLICCVDVETVVKTVQNIKGFVLK